MLIDLLKAIVFQNYRDNCIIIKNLYVKDKYIDNNSGYIYLILKNKTIDLNIQINFRVFGTSITIISYKWIRLKRKGQIVFETKKIIGPNKKGNMSLELNKIIDSEFSNISEMIKLLNT